MVSSRKRPQMYRFSANTTPSEVTSSPVEAQKKDKSASVLSLLCKEELNSSPGNAPAHDAGKDTGDKSTQAKPNDERPRSSSSVRASIMEYSLKTELSDEMGELIFGISGVYKPRPKPRTIEKTLEPKVTLSQSQPLFPEFDDNQDDRPKAINIAPKFMYLRPVTPEEQGRFDKLHLQSRPSQTPLSGAFRSSNVTPTEDKPATMKGIKKRKTRDHGSKKAKRATSLPNMSQQTVAMPVRPAAMDDIMLSATKTLSAMRTMTMSTMASPSTGASLCNTSRSTFTNRTAFGSYLPPTQPYWWPYPEDLPPLLPALLPKQQSPPPPPPTEPVRLFDDCLSDDEDGEEDASFGLINAKDLKTDTSAYMCLRDTNNVDVAVPNEISMPFQRQPSADEELPWFPVQQSPTILASQSSSAAYFGSRNNEHFKLQPQPHPSPVPANEHAYYGRRTRAPLIFDDELKEPPEINNGVNEYLHPFNMADSHDPLMQRGSSLYNQQQEGALIARTQSIQGDDDFGELLSHTLLPSPEQQGGRVQFSYSI